MNQRERQAAYRQRIAYYAAGRRMLGAILRNMRLERGLNQTQVGERVGLSRRQVSRTECGQRRIYLPELRAYCLAFDVTLLDMWTRIDKGMRQIDRGKESR